MASGSDLPTPATSTSNPGPNISPTGAAVGERKGQACPRIITFLPSSPRPVSAAISAAVAAVGGDVGGDGVDVVVAVVVVVVAAVAAAAAAAAAAGDAAAAAAGAAPALAAAAPAPPLPAAASPAPTAAPNAAASTASCRCSSTRLFSVFSSSLSGRRWVYRTVIMHSGQPPST